LTKYILLSFQTHVRNLKLLKVSVNEISPFGRNDTNDVLNDTNDVLNDKNDILTDTNDVLNDKIKVERAFCDRGYRSGNDKGTWFNNDSGAGLYELNLQLLCKRSGVHR
jgi:hypothetical protein